MGPRVTEVCMVHFDCGGVSGRAKLGHMKQWRFVRTFVHGKLVEIPIYININLVLSDPLITCWSYK